MNRTGLMYAFDRDRLRLVAIPAGGSGDEGGSGSGGGAGEATKGEETKGDEPRVFTQEEVSQMMAREKSQGRRAAEQDVAETLGVTVEEAAKIIQSHREAEQAAMSEAEKAAQAAKEREQAAEAREREAARLIHATKVERALGIDDEEKAKRVAKMLDLEVGADDAEISEAVKGLRESFPALFVKEGDPTPRRTAPSSTPGKTPPAGGPRTESGMARGAARAKQYAQGGVNLDALTG